MGLGGVHRRAIEEGIVKPGDEARQLRREIAAKLGGLVDNIKTWSGDHCIDPRLVPGVMLASRKIGRHDPAPTDSAPTALRLLGIHPPPHMDGRQLHDGETLAD